MTEGLFVFVALAQLLRELLLRIHIYFSIGVIKSGRM
jgi:hypothetical protein